MGLPRRAARIDDNQPDIIRALKAVGCSVEIIGKPMDLLICHRGETILLECKATDGRYTKDQVEFLARWPGRVIVARSAEEAVALVVGPRAMA